MSSSSRTAGLVLIALTLLRGGACPVRSVMAAPPAAGVSAGLSYGDAVRLLETRNHQLMAAADREDARRQDRAAARGRRLPTVQLNARATRIDDPIVIDLDPIRTAMLALHPTVPPGAVPPFESKVQDDNFFKADIGMTWPLYAGGAISAANRAAEARLGDAEAQTRVAEQTLRATLVDRYFGLQLADQARVIRRQVLEAMERHRHQAARLEDEGMISRAERLHAEVAHAEADRELLTADQDVRLATAALRTLLRTEGDPEPDSPMFIVHDLPPLDVLQRQAAQSNPNLRRLEAQQKLARSALSVERADYLPDVALFARYELYPDDLTILEPRWAAGIGIQLNVFDGFAREHRVKAARATVSMVDHTRQDAQGDIELLVERNYRRVVKAVDQYDSLDATVELARENLRVRTRAFEEGLATSLDVVDAVNTLAGVELARLGAAHDFVTSLAELLAAVGQADRFADYMHEADTEVSS